MNSIAKRSGRPMARLGGSPSQRSSSPTGPSAGTGYPWVDGDWLYAADLNAAIAAAGQTVTDWLPTGQPDGTTDLAVYIQMAIDAAAGHYPLIIPANATPYTIGSALIIPSNTHLIIEAGATIKILDHAYVSALFINANASNVAIDLYGTLDGNASNQIPFGGTASGGIVNGIPISDALIDGHRQGIVTNFYHWGVNLASATNVEVRGLAITNCGNSPEFAGITTRTDVVSGTHNAGSGAMTLTTAAAHSINLGDTFTYVAAPAGVAFFQGEFIATSVTSTSVTCVGPTGVPGPANWSGAAGTQGRIGTCTKCYNVGFVDCTVRDTRDIPLCFYGGVVGGYIRNCDVDAGPSIFSDVGQPGSNIDCELSGNYTHDGIGSGPSVGSNAPFIYQHNSRVFDNIVRNMARGGINLGYCDGVEVYGNLLHNITPSLQGASQQSGQIVVSDVAIKANIWGNTIRDPGVSSTAQQVLRPTSGTYDSSTGVTTLILASAPSPALNVGDTFIVFNMFGTGNYLALNGTWTALSGTTGSTIIYQAPAGLGAITIYISPTGAGVAVIVSTLAVTSHIAAGNYSSDASGNISVTTIAAHMLAVGDAFVLSGVFGSTSGGILSGLHTATTGTAGTTLNFVTVPSLASFAVTSGNVWPANFGISIDAPDYCRIAGNRIGDYQKPSRMTACIGGTWGLNGASEGNYFGPRNCPDADVSLYGNSVNGFNYDLLFGTTVSNNSIDGQVTFRGVSQASSPATAYYPPQGLTPGWNRNSGRGEIDFFLGEGGGAPGGFDFLQVAVIKTLASPVGPPIPYDPTTGIVTLTTNTAHGILPGGSFVLSGITGTDGNNGLDVIRLNGNRVANSDTTGTTLTYTMVPGLTVISTAVGATVVPSGGGGGVLKTSVGVGGSLLANDGYGNTRLGGALVHGAMQSVALVNAGTVTVNPSTSFVLIQNATSIAAATIVLPAPVAGQYATGAELELNFQNPVNALSWAGASVTNPPATIATAGTSVHFINTGTTWLRRASDGNSAAVGGPFLPISYAATGTPTARSAYDRAAESVNVKDFGAIGDGVADDTAAFLAAAAAVPAAGACIYVPSGTFMVGAAVLLKANTHLRGNGPQATTIKMRNGSNVAGLIGNAVNGASFISVSDLTVDGNKANNGAGTSQGINMVQVSQVTLRNVEVANVNGYGVTISGNGVNTTRGAYVSRVYIHHCDLTGFSVTFACRQTVIDGLICAFNGSTGNPTFAAIFLDASECVTSNVLADSNISNGIHIHNVFGCSYDGLTATRNGRHGIYVEVLTTSTGANWRAQSNGTQTSNTYDDIHFVNTNIASPGYGITANCSVNGITVGPDANFSGFLTERYGLYVEDSVTTNVHLADVSYVGACMTGNVRVPASLGTLTVDDVPFLKLTGGTVTGALTVSAGGFTVSNGAQITAQNPAHQFGAIANASLTMLLVGASSGARVLNWYSNSNAGPGLRWQLGTDAVAEGGSNAGTNFVLGAYSDTGVAIGTALSVTRSTMQATFAGPVRMNGTVGFNNTAPITKPTVSGAKGSNAALGSLLTALAAYGLITDSSTA